MSSDIDGFFERMKGEAPGLIGAFGAFHQTVMDNGALSVRDKELVALGIAVAQCCTPCINLRVQRCITEGATREQILEAAGVAVLMQGWPVITHLPEVLAALEHLEARRGSEQAG